MEATNTAPALVQIITKKIELLQSSRHSAVVEFQQVMAGIARTAAQRATHTETTGNPMGAWDVRAASDVLSKREAEIEAIDRTLLMLQGMLSDAEQW